MHHVDLFTNCKVHQGAQLQTQLIHDQGHIRNCPTHVYHRTVVTVDVVDLYHLKEELLVVSKCTNTQDSKTNSLSFGAMICAMLLIFRKFITFPSAKLNLKTGIGLGTIQLPLPDIVILKEKSENWLPHAANQTTVSSQF